ncbi:MAG: 5-(carboxyamino)imidazole ribonucleotide mutase [Planctomycetes bacterium]|nr:5-(carboxyamino)imidazole ribonucleotide mutase [Planctomycetota bacterium]
MSHTPPLVGILMGSDSDFEAMKGGVDTLKEFGVPHEVHVKSAHRSPEAVRQYVREAPGRGLKVLICAAGKAAHLAGVCAAGTTLPVLGVPMEGAMMGGMDALLSTVQMPPGVPVATFGVGASGAKNAAIFAVEILSLSDPGLAAALAKHRTSMAEGVARADAGLQNKLAGG